MDVDDGKAREEAAAAAAAAAQEPLAGDQAEEGEEGTLEERIVRQVEFYFSNENLWGDKYLRKQIARGEERYVPLDVICGFKRMWRLSMDTAEVARALAASAVLEVREDGLAVRRREPLPPRNGKKEARKAVFVHSIRAGSSVDSLRELFSQFGEVALVRFMGGEQHEAVVTFAEPRSAHACRTSVGGKLDALGGEAVVSRQNPGRALTPEERAAGSFGCAGAGGDKPYERAGNARLAKAFADDRRREAAAAPQETPEERAARRAKLYSFETTESKGRPPKLRLAMSKKKNVVKMRIARGPVGTSRGFAEGRVHPELAAETAAGTAESV